MLDREYTGIVFGLNARIHVCVTALTTSPNAAPSLLVVRSPQFIEAQWRYCSRPADKNGGIEVVPLNGYVAAANQNTGPMSETGN